MSLDVLGVITNDRFSSVIFEFSKLFSPDECEKWTKYPLGIFDGNFRSTRVYRVFHTFVRYFILSRLSDWNWIIYFLLGVCFQ